MLKKANRPCGEPKLREYTQTIVSGPQGTLPGGLGLGPLPVGLWVCRVSRWLLLQAWVK